MSGRAWLALLLVLALVGWWHSPLSPRARPAAAVAQGAVPACLPPPWGDARGEPLQSDVPSRLGPFPLQAATLTPLAGFRVEARVLGRRDYRSDRESALSPTDLALGWGRMADPAVLDAFEFSQSGRWFRWTTAQAPPIPTSEIVRSAANMHFIPADAIAARELARVQEGDRVRVEGWLVEAVAPDGWRWRSSLSRDDSGDGACELVYVCSMRRL